MFDSAELQNDLAPDSVEFQNHEIKIAVHALSRNTPENSAYGVLSLRQKVTAVAILAALLNAVVLFPITTFTVVNTLTASYFVAAIGYRFFLMVIGQDRPVSTGKPPVAFAAGGLPVITILAPLYRDAKALAALSLAIDNLDYPAEKTDVKLLLEKDDEETREEACRLGLNKRYDIIIIPEEGPRTKPKACNFGLLRARGELIVIYDAEDQPERDQLTKAAAAFANSTTDLACVQARLNYYNAEDNWLTRLFTLEYSLWFDWLLPALQKLGAPIPLGGTSNFFRTDILKSAGGWDPYNVTEDADLGLRLSKLGYRTEMLDSTTYEEANCQLGNWIRQRSRWIKGHLQTWLVHMRQPRRFVRTTGMHGLFSIQMFLAGNVVSALINPLLWGVFLYLQFASAADLAAAIPAPLQKLNLFALIGGNLCFIAFAAIAPLKRGWRRLCIYGITAPLYWLLTSIAAYKAVWQIIFRPYYWEKTNHTISQHAVLRRKAALMRVNAN